MKSSRQVSDSAARQDLGARLATRRLRLNLTQAQLAEEAGVSKRTIERLETGATATQLSAFLRVCRVLGLQEHIDQLALDSAPSPLAQLKLKGRTRKRASGETESANTTAAKSKRWTWGP